MLTGDNERALRKVARPLSLGAIKATFGAFAYNVAALPPAALDPVNPLIAGAAMALQLILRRQQQRAAEPVPASTLRRSLACVAWPGHRTAATSTKVDQTSTVTTGWSVNADSNRRPSEEALLSTRPGPPTGLTEVTVVESPACHFCADAHQSLDQLAADGHAFRLVTLDVREPAGQDLMRRHGAGLSPLVLVNGAFFSQGRLPRRKLSKLLERSSNASVVESHGA